MKEHFSTLPVGDTDLIKTADTHSRENVCYLKRETTSGVKKEIHIQVTIPAISRGRVSKSLFWNFSIYRGTVARG